MARAAAASTLIAALALLAIVGGCGGDGGASASGLRSGPAAFADESYAELATDGEQALWMAVAGYTRDREFGLRVFESDGAGWAELPVPPGEVSSDVPISFVDPGSGENQGPCLGYSVGFAAKPAVVCLVEDQWQVERLPRLGRGQLVELGREGGDLLALATELRGRRGRYRVLRERDGRWILAPPVLAPAAVARLAIQRERGSTSPAFGLATQGRSAQHYVFELQGGDWRKLRPTVTAAGAGPLVGGPVVLPDRILYPVNEAGVEPWSFSVQSARIGSKRARSVGVSSGAGNAQGRLDLAGGTVWATWQEDDPRADGRFQATIYAAEISPTGRVRDKIRLWRGISIGPGSTQVIEFQDRPVALYMRASDDGRGLRAAVRTLR